MINLDLDVLPRIIPTSLRTEVIEWHSLVEIIGAISQTNWKSSDRQRIGCVERILVRGLCPRSDDDEVESNANILNQLKSKK